jgi:hypothetical protein
MNSLIVIVSQVTNQVALGQHPEAMDLQRHGSLLNTTFFQPTHYDMPTNSSSAEIFQNIALTWAQWFMLSTSVAICKTAGSSFSSSAAALGGIPPGKVKDIHTKFLENP